MRLFPALLLLSVACGHSDPFGTAPTGSDSPFSAGTPTRLTYNSGTDSAASWTEDGKGLLYLYSPGGGNGDRCIGLIPPGGGTQRWQLCDTRADRADSAKSFSAPALASDGRLLYLQALAQRGRQAPDQTFLWLADSATPFVRRAVMSFPTYIGGRGVSWMSDAQWVAPDAFDKRLDGLVSSSPLNIIYAASNQWPLDYDRRIAFTAVVDGELSPAAGPQLFGTRPFGQLSGAAVVRYGSGLPYTRTSVLGDSLIGEINGSRLPGQFTVDLLLRRPVRLGGMAGGVYLDVRNLLDRRNQLAVRRETGTPNATNATIAALADAAYRVNPQAIPFESARYRRAADSNNDGVISGRAELYPLFEAAARDYTQPLFVYGPPRLVRFGLEVLF